MDNVEPDGPVSEAEEMAHQGGTAATSLKVAITSIGALSPKELAFGRRLMQNRRITPACAN
jgi:hypothetical protein